MFTIERMKIRSCFKTLRKIYCDIYKYELNYLLDRAVQGSLLRNVTEGYSLVKCIYYLNVFELEI